MKITTMGNSLLAGATLAVLTTLGYSPQAAAQTSPESQATAGTNSDEVKEIVVTALRHSSTLQTTPASVTAISSEQLTDRGISNVQDIAESVPGLSFGTTGGQAHIAIRGIGADTTGTGNDPRVAFYQDDVYIARPTAQTLGLFDIDRIEILKGPQGTLYGRNAMGGALNIISKPPTDTTTGDAHLSYGNYNDVVFDGALGGPIAEHLSGRVAVHEENHDGYGKNLVTGRDIDNKQDVGVRVSLLWTPTDMLSFSTIANYDHEADNSNGVHFIGQSNPAMTITGLKLGGITAVDSRDIASEVEPATNYRTWGVNETIGINTDWASFKSITAFHETRTYFRTDIDGTSVPLSNTNLVEDSRQFSEELEGIGTIGTLEWLLGAFYFHESISDRSYAPFSLAVLTGIPATIAPYRQGYLTSGDLGTDAVSPYARAIYHLNDRLSLTGGLRFNSEHRSVSDEFEFDFSRVYSPTNPVIPQPGFPRAASVTFTSLVPTATLDYKFSDGIFAYFTYSKGFKSGGYNLGVDQPPYSPEKLNNFEVGLKTTWLDRHLTADITAFHDDYTNLQVSEIINTTFVIENAAAATINGIEFQSKLGPFDGFSIDGSLSYLDTRYDQFSDTDPAFPAKGLQNLAGNQLTQAPRISFQVGLEKDWTVQTGRLAARADMNYVSRVYFTPFNDAALSQEGYALGSAFLNYQNHGGWSSEVYVKNIGNEKAVAQSYVSSALFGSPVLGTFIPPRTFGVRAGYSF